VLFNKKLIMHKKLSLDEFSEIASDTILDIIDTIEKYDQVGVADIEVEGDVVKISILDKNQYVLNKHNNYRQIWLVSPLSGPYHFEYLQVNSRNEWVDKKGIVLSDLLNKELSQFIDKIKF